MPTRPLRPKGRKLTNVFSSCWDCKVAGAWDSTEGDLQPECRDAQDENKWVTMLLARDWSGVKHSRPRTTQWKIIFLKMKSLVVMQLVSRMGMMCHSMTNFNDLLKIYISMEISNNKMSIWNMTSIMMMFPLFFINMSICSLFCK